MPAMPVIAGHYLVNQEPPDQVDTFQARQTENDCVQKVDSSLPPPCACPAIGQPPGCSLPTFCRNLWVLSIPKLSQAPAPQEPLLLLAFSKSADSNMHLATTLPGTCIREKQAATFFCLLDFCKVFLKSLTLKIKPMCSIALKGVFLVSYKQCNFIQPSF